MASRRWMVWLLLAPYAALLWVPWYARARPLVWGFPFFYWYMFAWVIVTAVLTGLVYKLR
ncbi:MAG: DUF3311 domain-containing protein [Terriglobales bacterium]